MNKKSNIRERVEDIAQKLAMIGYNEDTPQEDDNWWEIEMKMRVDHLLSIFSEILGEVKMDKDPTIFGGVINRGHSCSSARVKGYNQAVKEFNSKIEKVRRELK